LDVFGPSGSGCGINAEAVRQIEAFGATPSNYSLGRVIVCHTQSNTWAVPSNKPRVALTLDEDLHAELKAIAKAERRPLANLLESWIVAELERRRAKAKDS